MTKTRKTNPKNQNTTTKSQARRPQPPAEREPAVLLASLIENISEALIATDLEFNIREWNAAAETLYGWTAAEVVGHPLWNDVQNEFANTTRADAIQAVLATGRWKGEIAQSRKDGSRIHVLASVSLLKDPAGQPVGFVALNRDISELQQVEDQLRQSEERFSKAFHSAPTALILARVSDRRIEYVNESFLELVGYQREEVIGQIPAEISPFPDPEQIEKIRALLAETGHLRNFETTLRTKSGKIITVLYSVDIIQLTQQPYTLSTLIDISQRVQAEQKVVQLKRLYATLSQVNQTIVRVQDQAELYQSICDVALQFGELTFAWIGLLDEVSGDVQPVAASGLNIDINHWPFPILNIHQTPVLNPLIMEAWQTSRTVTSDDVQTDGRTQALQGMTQKFGFHSLAVVPFRRREKTVGILMMISVERGIFKAEEELKLLNEMGMDISFALDTMATRAEQMWAEAQSRASEKKFATLFLKAPYAIQLSKLPEGVIIDVNEEFENLLGYSREEALGKTSLELNLYPDIGVRARAKAVVDAQGSANNVETVLRTKSGELRSVLATTSILHILGTRYLLTTAQDITERKRVEEKLRLSEERFFNAFHASPAGLTITRIADGKFIEVNESFLSMFELTREEVVGHTSIELNILNLEERGKLIQAQLKSGGLRHAELVSRSKSGRVINLLFSSKPIELEGEACHITTMIDNTERKLAEEQLQASEHRLSTIFSSSPTGINIFRSSDGKSVEFNDAFLELIGYSREELLGHSAAELNLFVDTEIRQTWMKKLSTGEVLRNQDAKIRRKNGEIRDVLVTLDMIDINNENMVMVITNDITERRQAETAQLQIMNRQKRLIETSPDGIIENDINGNILNVNARFAELFGFESAEAILASGLNTFALLAPEEADTVPAKAQPIFEAGSVRNVEMKVVRRDGTVFTAEFSTTLADGDDNDPQTLITFIRDITERKRTEDALRASEQRFSTLFAKAAYAVTLSKLTDGVIVAANEAFERIFGFTQQETIGKTSREIGFQPDAEIRTRLLEQMKQNNSAYIPEMPLRTKSGEARLFAVHLDVVDIGGEQYILNSTEDITERKRAEEQLRYQAHLLENVNDAIVASDEYYQLKEWNLAAEEMYGWQAAEVLGRNGVDLLQTQFSEGAADELRRRIAEEGYYVGEATQLRKDGTRIPVEVASLVLKDAAGRITDYVSVNRDITERKQAEQRLRDSEQKYSILFDKSAVPAALLRLPEVVIVEVNEALEKLTGYTRQELLGQTAVEVGLGGRAERDRMLAEFQAHGTLNDNETPLRTKAGEQRIVVANTNPLLLNGQPYALTTLQDITERRRAENALRSSQAQMSSIFNSAMDAIISIDADQRIVIFNPAAEKIFRWSQAEALGQPLERLIPVHFRASHERLIREYAQSGVSKRTMGMDLGTLYGVRQDGEEFPIEASISKTDLAGKELFTVILRDITERRRAETALAASEQRFRALTENAADIILVATLDGAIRYANPTVQRLLGYTPNDLLNVNAFTLVHPEDLARMQDLLAQHFALDKGATAVEFRLRRRDDTWLTVDGIGTTITDEAGQLLGVMSARDITERKQAEAQIQRQLKYLQALRMIDSAISSSFDLQVTLNVVLQQVQAQLHVDACAVLLVNQPVQTIEYAASRGFHSKALQHTHLKLGEGYAGRTVTTRQLVHVLDFMEHGGKLAGALQMEAEVFREYYGVPLLVKGEIKGVLEIYHRSHLQADADWLEFLETLAGQAAIAIDNTLLFENIQRANLELERRVLERTVKLNQANAELEHANRAKDEFLANMSHELRTPLNSILGFSEALLEQRRGSLNAHQQNALKVIEASGQHLLTLINDILDLSKIEAGKLELAPETVAVDQICSASLAFIKAQALKKSIAVNYVNDAAVTYLVADPRRLKQILVNLLTNAVKFTPEHGSVTLQVGTDLEQNLIHFAVADSGIGIAPDDLQRLFQPFVQLDSSLNRQQTGSGLGLALVQKLVDLHGGSVHVESEVGQGSRFTIYLSCTPEVIQPLEAVRPEPNLSAQPEAAKADAARTATILLAEDTLSNVLTIGDYLESHHYAVIVAHDGLEVIAQAGQHLPDLILMDIQMPVMDGLEATRRLRADARFKTTPIIALTALAMPGDRERCLQAGANEYMSKPVSLKLLIKTIDQLLNSQISDAPPPQNK